jgi:hypothetical protein
MHVLLVHNNYLAQFRYLPPRLKEQRGCVHITGAPAGKCLPSRVVSRAVLTSDVGDDLGQSGGAAARRVRPGLRSLRSPAASGGSDVPSAGGSSGTIGRSASGSSRRAVPERREPMIACPCAA